MKINENMAETLDDLFFKKEDEKLIKHLKAMKKLKETKEALSDVSGIRNDHIIDKLVELNVRPETLASLSLIPLVEVAWADGNVDDKEKEAVLSSAHKMGFKKDSADYDILAQWMTHKPSKDLITAWVHYIQGLCEKLTESEKADLKKELIDNTKTIALASGGFLGLGNKISKAEADILSQLEKAFK